jgi:hypothetical protein
VDDNVEITVPAHHVRLDRVGSTEYATVLVSRDLIVQTADDIQTERMDAAVGLDPPERS